MDFFSNQDSARRNTRYLVVIYIFAVCMLIGLANLLIALCLWAFDLGGSVTGASGLGDFFSWRMLGKVSLGVTTVVVCAIILKWLMLSSGGKAVAESLGGRRIPPDTDDRAQQRVLNVVEEMALASGMPVPTVYLLDKERGINAFAAGFTPADAVIGITQGSLDAFNREQLQGVIAHEFSHILNGDMRLNLRLIALLNGILFIGGFGQFIMQSAGYTSSSSRRRLGSMRLVLVGLAMAVIGWLGTFFGGLIKAAINRQREYLADASAVQFTRNPAGIADALKIIGGAASGSRLVTAAAGEASHLFISNALGGLAIFKTHPPLEERIRRIEPGWDGRMVERASDSVKTTKKEGAAAGRVAAGAAVAGAVALGAVAAGAGFSTVNTGSRLPGNLPNSLAEKIHDPLTATAMIFALLLDAKKEVRERQLSSIRVHAPRGADTMAQRLREEMADVDPAWRIIIIEKTMPALKWMSADQYKNFRKVLVLLMRADQRVELFEWCLFQLIRHYLGAEFGDQRQGRPRFQNINDVAEACTLVLSVLVHHGHFGADTAERAFNRGATAAGLYTASLLPEGQCTLDGFSKAVDRLADCYPLLKGKILRGLMETARFDGRISSMENELITSIAAVMDSPLPRLQREGKEKSA